jgi:hypothetical protein
MHYSISKLLFLYSLVLFFPLNIQSQNVINGKIMDKNKEALSGVNVFIKGSYDGSSSNPDGFFSIKTNVSGKQILVVKLIGFKDIEQEIYIPSGDTLLFILQEDITPLDEVQIIAGTFEAGDKSKSIVLEPLDIALTASSSADIYGALSALPGAQLVVKTANYLYGEENLTKQNIYRRVAGRISLRK